MVVNSLFDTDVDVVISGIGGAFPKTKNIEEFKKALLAQEDLFGSRWKEGERGVCNKLGTVSGVELFDSAFFGIHRHQASYMDPMQRMLMERTFEALVDAGVNPQEIRGKKVGVYTASSIGENDNLFYESVVSGFGVTGHSRAMMANRLSYWLNLKGPSCAYDSNWNGGIEVLTMAVDAVSSGLCEAAIIGTANIALNSEISWHYNDLGLLSEDGSTKAYDADACGYARADGIIAMFIQRADEAKRSYATVVHSATIFNGAREGPIMELSLSGMTDFIENFYKQCGVNPGDVGYVETYGCAIKETDEIELKAIENVYCKNRQQPLLIGSVKTQAGHSEASANLTSIAKVIIAFESGIIPAHTQFVKPNPNIPGLFNGNLEVVSSNRKWDGDYASVHGIGLVSSYSHVLFKRNPKVKKIVSNDLPKLVVASSRHEAGIQELLKTVQSQPIVDPEYLALIHELYSKTISGNLHRGYTIISEAEEVKQEVERYPGNKRPIWFIYSGMGSQWPRMACELMKLPIFAESIMKSQRVLEKKGIDLIKIITTDEKTIFDNILHSFVGIAAVQIALTDILRAIGIVPDGIIGHSVGELGCAYADGCLTAEQMILCSYSRGRASNEASVIRGMMAAIGRGYNQMKDEVPPTIEVACHNASDSCTLSGPTEDMEVYVKSLQDKGIFARLVNVSNIAYHSRYIKPAAPGLYKYLKEIIPEPKRRSSKWICTSQLEENWDNETTQYCSADYHTNNLLNQVYFEEGSKHIPKDAIAIEIAPHGLLQAILKRSLKGEVTNIPLTLRSSKNPLEFLLSALGKIYLTGVDMNLTAIYPPVSFPVSRSTMTLSTLVHWEHSERWRTGIEDKLNYLVSMKDTQVSLSSEEFKKYAGHELDDNVILPVSAYLAILLEILTIRSGTVKDVILEDLKFKNPLVVPKVGSVPLYAMLQKGSGSFEILSGDLIICTGVVKIPEPTDVLMTPVHEIIETEDTVYLTASDVYNELFHRRYKYSDNFKPIKDIKLTNTGSIATIKWETRKWQELIEGMLQLVLLKQGEKYQNVLVPSYIQKIVVSIENFPTDSRDVQVTYNYYTRIVSTDAVQIISTETKALKETAKPLTYYSIEYVPFNAVAENIEIVINNSIQVVLENFDDPLINSIIIIETESENPLLTNNIKNVVSKNLDISANLSLVKDNKVAILSQTTPVLIVSNQDISEDLAKTVMSSHAFALVRSNKNLLSYEKLVQVFQAEINGIIYSLVRKASSKTPEVVRTTGDVLSVEYLSNSSVPWVVNLNKQLAETNIEEIFLVTSLVPLEGITNFVQALRNIPHFKLLKFLFLLDQHSPNFDPKEKLFQNILQKGLITSVLKDGQLGSYLPIPIDFKGNIKSNQVSPSTLIANKNLEYIGINADDETILVEKYEIGLGNIDYSGVNNQQERIMGLARWDPDTSDLLPDPVLVWSIPERWSMVDGCTIPHAYVTAYYCLVLKAGLEHGDTVLIHNGCSAIGYAAISIALSYGCTVFTTVATDRQRSYLKNMFYKLRDRNILSSRSTSFEPLFLLATGGEGAQVIINCLPKNLLNATIRCLGEFGRFIQLGKYDVKQKNSIGMSVFLKNTSFYGVIPEEVFDSSVEDKRKLYELVRDGIEAGTISPLKRTVVDHENIKNIIQSITRSDALGKVLIKVSSTLTVNYLNTRKPNQFICETNNSYLVCGGAAEIWADLVEWLVLRGARKIVISSGSKSDQVYIQRRLNLLRNYFNAQIVYQPDKTITKQDTNELILETYALGPVHAVFLLPDKNLQIKSVQNIDAALRTSAPKVLLINFLSSAGGVVRQRSDAGYFSYNIQWPASLHFLDALYGLDEILTLSTNDLIIKSDKVDDGQETAQVLYKKITLVLPQSSDELLDYFKKASEKPTFEQVLTSGPVKIREVPPIFIIPGLFKFSNIEEMCRGLLHPTFVAKLPKSKMSLQDIAVILAQEIRTIFPKGPYNIVGVSWGGILSIEIAKILETHRKTQVTFVDGAPDTIQGVISNLGKDANAEVNILSRMLNIASAETLKKLNASSEWNSRLTLALSSFQEDKNKALSLKTALDILLHLLKCVESYTPGQELNKGGVFLLRPSGSNKYDNCGLNKYFEQQPEIHTFNGDHISMLQLKEFVDTVNDNVIVR